MSWFRKGFLTKIRKEIFDLNGYGYCCHVNSWHKIFICWKDLKEVKENLDSKYIKEYIFYNCSNVWFRTYDDRIAFLDECLNKFK